MTVYVKDLQKALDDLTNGRLRKKPRRLGSGKKSFCCYQILPMFPQGDYRNPRICLGRSRKKKLKRWPS